jgi:hypothetical protein
MPRKHNPDRPPKLIGPNKRGTYRCKILGLDYYLGTDPEAANAELHRLWAEYRRTHTPPARKRDRRPGRRPSPI